MATPSVAAPARPRGPLLRWGRLPAWLRYAALLAVLLGIWQGYWAIKNDDENFHLLFAGVREVGAAFWEGWRDGPIANATWTTLRILGLGIGIGAAIAAVLTAFATVSRIGDDLLRLLTAILNPLPGVAVLPLAMLWFGLNTRALLFVIANATIWPIAINLTTGFRTANQTIVAVGRNIGLNPLRLITDVLAPAALPYAIAGLKTAWAFGWRTMIAAELIFGVAGAKGGLGFFINDARLFLHPDDILAGLVTIATLGVVFDFLFTLVERRTVERWGMKAATS